MFKGELFGYLTIPYLIILATRDSIDAAPIHRGHKRKNEIKPEIASRAVFLDLMPELDKPITNVMEYLTTHGQLSKRKKKQRLHLASQRRRTNKNKQTIKAKSNENLNPNNPNENNSENFEITLATPGALEPRDFINHRMKMNSYMRVWGRYNPQNKNLGTVCIGRSTIYNIPKVEKYLDVENIRETVWHTFGFANWWKASVLFMDLRSEIFIRGRSEECHTIKHKHWRTFLECSLRRNQRMEYMIPKYPLHQIPYHHQTILKHNTKF